MSMKPFPSRERFLSSIFLPALFAAFLIYAGLCPALAAFQAQSSTQNPPATPSPPPSQNQSPPAPSEKSDKSDKKDKKAATDPPTVKLRIEVTGADGKPVGNASVYVRFNEPGGLFHKEKLAELNFKTNQDGSVKVTDVPQGRILIQVVAKGWHTFGKWYEIDTEEQTVPIKLDPPPHWY